MATDLETENEVYKIKNSKVGIKLFKLLLISLISLNEIAVVYSYECMPRQYEYDSIVCVCNSTYCDTIEDVDPPKGGFYSIYTTTLAGARFKKTVGQFGECASPQGLKYRAPLSANQRFQKFFGFGGAFTDSAGMNILSLSEGTQNNLLQSYFSEKGIQYNMGRVPIGGTDFSSHPYSYDDNNDIPDPNLTNFTLQYEDFTYKIPIIKRAQAIASDPLWLVASCWSPPGWMKTNNNLTGMGLLNLDQYARYAEYTVKFLDAYKKQGINIWGITTGNEPQDGLTPNNRLNALGWIPYNQSIWVGQNLGPQVVAKYPNLQILAVDDQRTVYPWWLNEVMRNNGAGRFISGAAVHWYFDNLAPPTVYNQAHDNFKDEDIFILNTESSIVDFGPNVSSVALGDWARGEQYFADMLQDFNHWLVGWIDWNLALDPQGGPTWIGNYIDSAIIVNSTADEFYKQPIFYAMGHYAKFIPRGSYRMGNPVNETSSPLGILTVQRPDNTYALFVQNTQQYNVTLTITAGNRGCTTINILTHSMNTIVFR